MKTIQQVAYEKYKLGWMLQHGYTLEDLVDAVTDYMDEVGFPFKETYQMWEQDSGFNGEIWACYDEFVNNEYQDEEYMRQILDDCEFEQYRREVE